ncbi:MAG TPA: bifunctional nuclease family protein [Ktedonobacterales bacterium]|nr:bifunctional nuclease family protein [Ktedonobacterales bacterium]
MVEMTVDSVRINVESNQRVVILKDPKSERYLFIWIANPEAYSIALELQGATAQRPLTHDLLKSVIVELGGKLTSIIINDLIDDIFYARLVLDASGRHVEIDSRSSDAIALAVRLKVNIYVEESVLERAGVQLQAAEEREERAPRERSSAASSSAGGASASGASLNLDVYRDFINGLESLDEFGKSD